MGSTKTKLVLLLPMLMLTFCLHVDGGHVYTVKGGRHAYDGIRKESERRAAGQMEVPSPIADGSDDDACVVLSVRFESSPSLRFVSLVVDDQTPASSLFRPPNA